MNGLLAQNLTLPDGTTITSPATTVTSLGGLISTILKFALPISGIALLIMIISAGFTLLTSAGDAKSTEKGKQTLTYAIVGFIVIFAAYWITQIAGIVFGIQSIQDIFK